MIDRRTALGGIAALAAARAIAASPAVFDVHAHGAIGDGATLDTAAIQRAIDTAAAVGGGARVLLRSGKTYLVGQLTLKSGIDLHLEEEAVLRVSTRPGDYSDQRAGVLHALGADDLTISGRGSIDGCSPDFMERFDAENEWWIPKPFRPRLLVLENCTRLTIRDVTFRRAPSWTVHLLGCRNVLITHVTIRNQLDVPNCDGIDPDHCQDVEIRDCHIICGDDAIVIKTTAGNDRYGASRNITVRDCVLETQDSGVKIGTETTQDIHHILFERCRIVTACRGLCIQLRDGGSVHDIVFRDITFVARYHSPPWWGRGEAISFTAIPRTPGAALGAIHDIRVENVTGHAENSIRIDGHARSRIHDVSFDRVAVTLGRWTRYPGGMFDNRPTSAVEPIEPHGTPGISVRHADRVTFVRCRIRWDARPPAYFSHALEAEDVTALDHRGVSGAAAHPERDRAIVIRESEET